MEQALAGSSLSLVDLMVMLNPSTPVYPHKLRRLYWPFLALAECFQSIIGTVAGSFHFGQQHYTIPRFTFLGPSLGVAQKRIGLFALLHGDELAGSSALLKLLQTLSLQPQLAAGYDLVVYPVCNPTGYEDGTRHNRGGTDLNREFWRGSHHPEVGILEEELRSQDFAGIIALHADDTSDGLYGYTHDRLLNRELLGPALQASELILPRNRQTMIDGFAACEGVIGSCFSGILAPPPDRKPRPFEVIFETPARSPLELQIEATHAALLSMLATYRGFAAYAQDI